MGFMALVRQSLHEIHGLDIEDSDWRWHRRGHAPSHLVLDCAWLPQEFPELGQAPLPPYLDRIQNRDTNDFIAIQHMRGKELRPFFSVTLVLVILYFASAANVRFLYALPIGVFAGSISFCFIGAFLSFGREGRISSIRDLLEFVQGTPSEDADLTALSPRDLFVAEIVKRLSAHTGEHGFQYLFFLSGGGMTLFFLRMIGVPAYFEPLNVDLVFGFYVWGGTLGVLVPGWVHAFHYDSQILWLRRACGRGMSFGARFKRNWDFRLRRWIDVIAVTLYLLPLLGILGMLLLAAYYYSQWKYWIPVSSAFFLIFCLAIPRSLREYGQRVTWFLTRRRIQEFELLVYENRP